MKRSTRLLLSMAGRYGGTTKGIALYPSGPRMNVRDELLLLLLRAVRDKASLTATDWGRLDELERSIRHASPR
jgi:hypothetical protein